MLNIMTMGEQFLLEFWRRYAFCSDTPSHGQVSAWQSATQLQISCQSVQPVPAWVEEPVSPVRQAFIGGATNNPPFPKMLWATGGFLPVRIPPQAENTTMTNKCLSSSCELLSSHFFSFQFHFKSQLLKWHHATLLLPGRIVCDSELWTGA